MSKTVLMLVGVVAVVMGLWAVMTPDTGAIEPLWHAWAKVIVGAVLVIVAMMDKKPAVQA